MNLKEPALCQSTVWGRSGFYQRGFDERGPLNPLWGYPGHPPPEIIEISSPWKRDFCHSEA